jgi:hypothetical protein
MIHMVKGGLSNAANGRFFEREEYKMILKILLIGGIVTAACPWVVAQNTNSSTTSKPRTATTKPSPAPSQSTDTVKPKTPAPVAKTATPKPSITTAAAGSAGVQEAFNKLLDGIRHANVNEVTSVYWNSPRLALFNNNGTVTKGGTSYARTEKARTLMSKTSSSMSAIFP